MVISSLTIDASSKFYTKANSNLIVSGAVNINGLLQGDPMGYAQINTNQDGVYVFSGGQLSGPVKVCEHKFPRKTDTNQHEYSFLRKRE